MEISKISNFQENRNKASDIFVDIECQINSILGRILGLPSTDSNFKLAYNIKRYIENRFFSSSSDHNFNKNRLLYVLII